MFCPDVWSLWGLLCAMLFRVWLPGGSILGLLLLCHLVVSKVCGPATPTSSAKFLIQLAWVNGSDDICLKVSSNSDLFLCIFVKCFLILNRIILLTVNTRDWFPAVGEIFFLFSKMSHSSSRAQPASYSVRNWDSFSKKPGCNWPLTFVKFHG